MTKCGVQSMATYNTSSAENVEFVLREIVEDENEESEKQAYTPEQVEEIKED